MNPYVMAAAATIGAFGGLQAASKRNDQAYLSLMREDTLWELRKKQLDRGGALARGNLSMAALGASANNREAAMAAFQQDSAGLAKVGQSGTIGGTSFYKLDQDIRDNAMRLREQEAMNRGSVEQAVLSLRDTKDSSLLEEQQHIYRKTDLAKEEDYTGSPFAMIMGAVTGAASGVSTAASFEKGLYDLNLLKEPKSTTAAPDAGAFDALPAATPGGLQDEGGYEMPWGMPPSFEEAGRIGEANRIALEASAARRMESNGTVFSFDGGGSQSWVPGASFLVPGFDGEAPTDVPFEVGGVNLFNMERDLFVRDFNTWLSRGPIMRKEVKRDPFGRAR